MENADDLMMRMIMSMKSVQQHHNMFLVDGSWTVSSVVKLTDDKIDTIGYERLQSRLRLQQVCDKRYRKFLHLLFCAITTLYILVHS